MSSVSDPRFRAFQHLQIPQDLLADLASTVAEKKGKLFVHCEAGVNRSGALCLAYHLSSSQVGLVDSAKHCQLARLGTGEVFWEYWRQQFWGCCAVRG